MHTPDSRLGPDQQDKRSVMPIEKGDFDLGLTGAVEEAKKLLTLAPEPVRKPQ